MTSDDIYKTGERYGEKFTGWTFDYAGLSRFARQIAEQAKAEEREACLALIVKHGLGDDVIAHAIRAREVA